MRSPEHALAFQSAFKGVLYTPKLPINRTSGHYVTNICCGIISTVTIRIIIIIISTDTITITLLSLLLYYYWWGVVGVGLSRPPPRAASPPPRSVRTTVDFGDGRRRSFLLIEHTRVRNIAIGSAQGAIVQNMFGGSSLFTFPCFLWAWSFKNIWTNIGTFGYRLKSAVQFVSYLLGGRVGLDEALCGLHFLLDPTHIPSWTRDG
jgi:hypothetical protein